MRVYQNDWSSQAVLPWEGLAASLHRLSTAFTPLAITNALDITFAFLFIGLAVWGLRTIPFFYSAYTLPNLKFILTRLGSQQPLRRLSPFVISLFPALLVLANATENPVSRRIVTYIWLGGLVYLTVRFVTAGWVG